MTKIRSQRAALQEAVRRWGARGAVRDAGAARATTPESRAAAHLELRAHIATEPKFTKLADWPETATVGEYRSALREHNLKHLAWKERRSELWRQTYNRRYAVGVISLGFEIKGEGDTWDEAFANAKE